MGAGRLVTGKALGGGGAEWRLLGRSRNQSVKLDGAETAWETRKQAECCRGWEQYAKGREVESHIRGTWEKGRVSASVGEGREEGVGPHRILPTPQLAYWPTSYQKAVLPSASPPPTTPYTHWTWGCLQPGRADLNNCQKPTTTGSVSALACLPFGGATPPWRGTKHRQALGKGLQHRKVITA